MFRAGWERARGTIRTMLRDTRKWKQVISLIKVLSSRSEAYGVQLLGLLGDKVWIDIPRRVRRTTSGAVKSIPAIVEGMCSKLSVCIIALFTIEAVMISHGHKLSLQ
jgi:hypothetical protein